MKPDDADLSAFLDGEASPVEHEATRLRILRDPETARAYETLRSVSDLLRARFAAAAAAVPAEPPAGLDASALRRVDRAAGRARLLRRAGPVVAVVACAAAAYAWLGRGDHGGGVAALEAAARTTLAEEAYVEFSASAPALALFAGGKIELRGVVGPGGRFVGAVALPSGVGLPGPLAGVLGRAERGERGSVVRAGFDGTVFWRHSEGSREVFVAEVDAETRASCERRFAAAVGLGGAGGGEPPPGLDWDAWREVVERMAQGGAEISEVGSRVDEGETLRLYAVKWTKASGAPRAGQAVVGVDARGDLRLVETPFVKAKLRRLERAPDGDVFAWRSYAPGDAAVVATRLPGAEIRPSGEGETSRPTTRRRE